MFASETNLAVSLIASSELSILGIQFIELQHQKTN